VARGARLLALLSRRPLRQGSGAHDAVRALEAAGARIELHHGELTDRDALAGFLAGVRKRLGPVAGVLHCAGSVSRRSPAFVKKTAEEIAAVWRPKGEGLLVLDELVAADRPDFVVLYSSICAAIPALAAGLADYASGNAFLDAYAAHRDDRTATRYLAIGWGSWAGPGMGEARSPRYRDLGFSALTPDQGLGLLEAALSAGTGGNVIATVETGEPPMPALTSPPDNHVTSRVTEFVIEVLARELMIGRERITPDTPFGDLGVDSILIAGMLGTLEAVSGVPLEPLVILEHPTAAGLARHLAGEYPDGVQQWAAARAEPSAAAGPAGTAASTAPSASSAQAAARPAPADWPRRIPLAIVGMAGRFPGADSPAEFWSLLREGRSAIRQVPASRWDAGELYAPRYEPGRCISKWGGFIDGIEDFDPRYFDIDTRDAAHVDPLIRLILECTENTIRDAGYERADLAGRRIGVFVGSGTSNYGSRIRIPDRNTATGLNQNFIAAQVAHFYDLHGPNLTVDTACSSAISALYLAAQSITVGECEMAVVGGADLLLDEVPFLKLSAARALSPDGICHVFDADANGIVLGEGAGTVLIKPVEAALADGDRIYAVVESCAMNNDGRTMGLTTPNPEAQERVVLDALDKAGVRAGEISYIEAHGTGTMIGDPMELRSLTRAFGRFTHDTEFCAVGSVKSNIGHLLMAAGMAALQKVTLALANRTIPATLHCGQPNPRFSFPASPFYPNVTTREWSPSGNLRRAGLSSFGFGGVNCHAIMRELTGAERARHREPRNSLPSARFHRRRYWVDRPPADGSTARAPVPAAGLPGSGPADDGRPRRAFLELAEELV
jgi:3-oxoacyl-(acyl-carrier-protein) synthase/acyl carrier protein